MVRKSKHGRTPEETDGNAMGLTEAFHPVSDDGFTTAMAPLDESGASLVGEEVVAGPDGAFEAFDLNDGEQLDDEGLPEGESFPDEEAYKDFYAGRPLDVEPADGAASFDDGHASREEAPLPEAVPLGVVSADATVTKPASKVAHSPKRGEGAARGRHAKHASAMNDGAKKKGDVPEYMRKSRRMRRILIVVIVLLVLILAAMAYFGVQLYKEASSSAVQQVLSTEQETEAITPEDASDSADTAKVTTVPDLVTLLGLTQEQAVEKLQHGATPAEPRAVNEEGNPIKTEVRVALTAEPADSRTGTPTVYLGLDADGEIIQAGYSTSTSSLGYGSLSFKDAVLKEHIIEKTLAEAGVPVHEDAVVLPDDAEEYTSYDTDGTTITKEYCSFNGEVDIDGAPHAWSAVLSYDYSMANASDNLADTVRTIFIYVNS
ncbi:histone-lysine N-methyltransferase [Adlercreutzia shanghongiae]|uniref:Histone-lysine N-methyltransferase n=1 Tax=Adlercreutzia shanghongiae TaxID=3111773 RepID=A0ABU6IXF0_9ACTN|nr:histone-lysine N-methyltransferase [Adlercreutzia sp. R22]MEC4294536.1 histone-lysine N-methyltransferase [Adlercreutzia sp. R22]